MGITTQWSVSKKMRQRKMKNKEILAATFLFQCFYHVTNYREKKITDISNLFEQQKLWLHNHHDFFFQNYKTQYAQYFMT